MSDKTLPAVQGAPWQLGTMARGSLFLTPVYAGGVVEVIVEALRDAEKRKRAEGTCGCFAYSLYSYSQTLECGQQTLGGVSPSTDRAGPPPGRPFLSPLSLQSQDRSPGFLQTQPE